MIERKYGPKVPTALFVSTLLFASNAWASTDEEFNSWQNTLVPLYLWGQSLSGTMTKGTSTVPLDLEFSDAVSDLEAAYTVHYEGAKGHWGVILDYSFLNITPSADVAGTPISVDVDMKNTIAEVAGLYRFGANNPWQLLAGYRSYNLDVTVKGLPGPSGSIDIEETINDFFIGGRYITQFSDRWTFTGRADIGTGDSDLVWHASAIFDYQFTKLLSGLVGWRVIDYDVDQGSGADRFKYDMTHSGPLLALAFRW
jgi:hypothetical protein